VWFNANPRIQSATVCAENRVFYSDVIAKRKECQPKSQRRAKWVGRDSPVSAQGIVTPWGEKRQVTQEKVRLGSVSSGKGGRVLAGWRWFVECRLGRGSRGPGALAFRVSQPWSSLNTRVVSGSVDNVASKGGPQQTGHGGCILVDWSTGRLVNGTCRCTNYHRPLVREQGTTKKNEKKTNTRHISGSVDNDASKGVPQQTGHGGCI
jgi:hypothetical protein